MPALRALQNAGHLRLSAIVDPSVSARDFVARSFPKAGQAASLEQTTAPAGTLAIIASPPGFHASQTIAAFERGWNVLCEKPMASSVSEAESMIAAAQRHQRLLAVGFYKRFFPSSRYIRSLCRDWELGPLTHFSISEGGPFNWPAGPSFFDREQTRGGVLFDIGVHVFDLLGWWLGEPSQVRYADDAMGGLETNAFVHLQYPGGAQGHVHLSRDWATSQQYRFVFERGIVVWKVNDANGLTVQLSNAPAALQLEVSPGTIQQVTEVPSFERSWQDRASGASTHPFVQRLLPVVPHGLKRSAKAMIAATSPKRPTDSWTLPARARPRITQELALLQQCAWKFPHVRAEQTLE